MSQQSGSYPLRGADSVGVLGVAPSSPRGLSALGLISGVTGTLVIHGIVLALAVYLSKPSEEKEDVRPRRTIIATEIAKLGGSGSPKDDPTAMPDKPPPPVKTPKGMAAPIPDPEAPERPKNTSENAPPPDNEKPSLQDLIHKNAQGTATEEGAGEGSGSGPGVAGGSPTGTGMDPNALSGWQAEVGSLVHTYWSRPSTISDARCRALSVGVKLKLKNNLGVDEYEIKKSSGDVLFDSSVSAAFGKMITEDARFPMPPPEAGISKTQLTSGRLTIRLNCSEIKK